MLKGIAPTIKYTKNHFCKILFWGIFQFLVFPAAAQHNSQLPFSALGIHYPVGMIEKQLRNANSFVENIKKQKLDFIHNIIKKQPSSFYIPQHFTNKKTNKLKSFAAPNLTGLSANVAYNENIINAAATIIDNSVTHDEGTPASATYTGFTLNVTYTSGGDTEDQLGVANEGTAVGEISVVGTEVFFTNSTPSTIKIGDITSNGANGADLIITFVAGAQDNRVENLVEAITYQNTSDTPTASRTVGFTITNSNGTTPVRNVTITVNAENDVPTITEGASANVNMSEDGNPTAFNLTLNVTDPDNTGGQLTWSIFSAAGNGTATANGTGLSKVIGYTPNANYSGTDAFTVRVTDSGGLTDDIVVNVTIAAVNDPPVITQGASTNVNMSEDSNPTAFNLTLNVTDPDNTGGQLTWSIFSAATNGTAMASGTGLSKVTGYTPNANFSGTDAFTVRVTDTDGLTDDIVVNVTIAAVNDPPNLGATEAGNVAYTEGQVAVIISPTGLDITDIDHTNLVSATVSITANHQSGSDILALSLLPAGISNANFNTGSGILTLTGTGTLAQFTDALRLVTYINTGDNPTATGNTRVISFQVNDGTNNSNSVSRTIDLTASNDDPVITEGTSINVNMSEDGNPTAFSLTLNATDPDNTGGQLTWSILNAATNGTATASGTGLSKVIGYTPTANFSGVDAFTVRVTDSGGLSDDIVVSVTITAANDAPVLAATTAGGLAYSEGASATIISPTGLDITDADNTNLTSAIVSITANYQTGGDILALTLPQTGISTAVFNPGSGILTITGTGTLANFTNALRLVTYQSLSANPTATGTSRTVSFQVNDGTSNSNIQTRTINITAANDAPVITEGLSVNVNMTEDSSPTAFSLTLNATDPDNTGGQLTWSIFSAANNGTATTSGTGLSKVINYTPGANFNGTDAFTVRVTDTGGLSDDITVNVTITAVNDEPVATPQNLNGVENTELQITLSGDDGDAEVAQSLTFIIAALPATGTLSNTSGGAAISAGSLPFTLSGNTVFFTPAVDNVSPQNFSFRVQDNGGTANGGDNTSPNATINIAIALVNNQPIANAQNVTTAEETEVLITLTGSDGDANAVQALTFILNASPTRGFLSATSGGAAITIFPHTLAGATVYYRPQTNNFGPQSFSFSVMDDGGTANGGQNTSNAALVSINIDAVNDQPTLNAIPDEPDITKNSNPNSKTLSLIGITSGNENEFQNLTLTASSSHPSVIANPVITYTSPDPTASLFYQVTGTVAIQTNVTITVTLMDDGGTANGGVNTIVRTFIISVLPLPNPPSNFSASTAALSQINLSWTNFAGNEGYEIWRSTTPLTGYTLLTTPATDATFFADASVATEGIYYYTIRTIKALGNSDFSDTIVSTTVLREPSSLFAQSVSSTEIKLTWQNNSVVANAYQLQRSITPDFSAGVINISINNILNNEFTDSGLNAETRYYYRLKVVNSVISPPIVFESANSAIVTDFTFLIIPQNFTVLSNNSAFLTITWLNTSVFAQDFVIERSLFADNFSPANPGFYTFSVRKSGSNNFSEFDANIELETRYYYRIKSTAPEGESSFTTPQQIFTFLKKPSDLIVAPLTATRNRLTWENNSIFTTGYEIQRSLTSGSGFQQIKIISGANTTDYIDNDVLPNTIYYYKVRALGQESNSEFTDEAIISIFPPSNLTATTLSASEIHLEWTNNATNFIGNIIERSEISQNTGFVAVASVGNTFNTFTDINLQLNKQYYYRLRAFNASDTSATSNVAGAFTADVPAGPTNLILTVLSTSEIRLQWNDNANNETSYRIERANILTGDNSFIEITAISSAGLGVGQFSYNDGGLLPNQTYRYRVRASNQNGNSGYSNIAVAAALPDPLLSPPLAPEDLKAEAVSDDQINLNWRNEADNAKVFKIYRSTSPAGPFNIEIDQVQASKTRYQNIGLLQVPSPGNAYFYQVRASNEGGDSDASETVSAIANCNSNLTVLAFTDAPDGTVCNGKAAALTLTTNAVGASFQWRRDGANIAGATLPTFIASQDGDYTCQISAGSCLEISNEVSIVVRDDFEVRISQNNAGALVASVADGSNYQWFRNFVEIPNATDDIYIPDQAGSYFVIVTKVGCSSSSNVITVNTVTGLEDFDFSNLVVTYPNPTNNELQLSLEHPVLQEYQIYLIDCTGKRHLLKKGRKNAYLLNEKINLADLAQGLYLIELKCGAFKGLKKVMKN